MKFEVSVGDWVVYLRCIKPTNKDYNEMHFVVGQHYRVVDVIDFSTSGISIYVETKGGHKLLDLGEYEVIAPFTLEDCL
jgi:hypothetical protein